MEQAMTPSQMTEEQINKAVANYRAMLVKHAPDFASSAVQQVLGSKEFARDQLGLFRSRVEAISNLIARHVVVNRTRTPMEAIEAAGRNKYLNDSVVATMPRGESGEADVIFFRLGRDVSDANLDKEYDLRDLKPADPYALAAVNEADPAFADNHPNSTHWKDVDGNWCYAAFRRWRGKRSVDVYRNDRDWLGDWWFAGLRK